MADVSRAAAVLAASFAAFGAYPSATLAPSLQTALDQAASFLAPVSPLDEARVCDAGRTALRAGAGGAETPFDPTGEGFGSGGGGVSTSGTVYETADGWRCEVEQVLRDGRTSLEVRIHAPPAAR